MNSSGDVQLVRATPGFRDLDPAVLEALLATTKKRQINAGKSLFDVGQPFLDEVYIVRRGEIALQRANGRTEKAAPGYLVGLSSYLGDSPYASTAVAREDTELLVIPASELRQAERREPLASGGLTQSAASIMSTPLSTCSSDSSIREVLETMLRDKVGSLVVVDAGDQLRGMVTFRTLAKRLAQPGVDAALEPAANALQPATTVAGDTPLWQAQDVQERERRA
jgi:CBS domain-containing protein